MTPRPKSKGVGALFEKNDEALASDLRAGNADALNVLFERYCEIAFAIAYRILKNAAEAEEIVQHVFFEIYRNIDQFDASKGRPSKDKLKRWLLKLVEFRAIDHRRQLRGHGFYSSVDIDSPIVEERQNGDLFDLCKPEVKQFVNGLLRKLTPRQCRVITLTYYAGMTLKEIEGETGESAASVRRLFYEGMAKLREAAGRGISKDNGKTRAGEAAPKGKVDEPAPTL